MYFLNKEKQKEKMVIKKKNQESVNERKNKYKRLF